MIFRSIFALLFALHAAMNLFADETALDNRFFVLMTEALQAQSDSAVNLYEKKTNAEAFYLLAARASMSKVLSNDVRFSVAASAAKSFSVYFRMMQYQLPAHSEFTLSSEASEAVFLLEDSVALLNRTQKPQVVGNVSPPVVTNAPIASGMDPKNIQDTKARQEYIQKIEMNRMATHELNSRVQLEKAIVALRRDIKQLYDRSSHPELRELLGNAVQNSKLPADIKAEFQDVKRGNQ